MEEMTVEEARRGGYIKASGSSKYKNVPTYVDGIRFDSQREARHWQELVLRQAAGEISELRRQVRYGMVVEGQHICTYVADFVWTENGKMVVADSKGAKTAVYLLKKKLLKATRGIDILEL